MCVRRVVDCDVDVLDWLKLQGKGYQTCLNRILRAAMEHQTPGRPRAPKSPKRSRRRPRTRTATAGLVIGSRSRFILTRFSNGPARPSSVVLPSRQVCAFSLLVGMPQPMLGLWSFEYVDSKQVLELPPSHGAG